MLLKILGFVVVIFLIYIFFFKNKRKEEIAKKRQRVKSSKVTRWSSVKNVPHL